MPGPNFLATRHGTSIGQVFELRGSTIAEQIGANVSRHVSALSELQRAGPFAARLHGQLMGFFGNFDTTSGGIYRWDLDTQAWIRFYNFSARQRTDGLIDGGFCMVTGTNGHPYLISFGQDQFQVRYWLRVNSPTSVTGFFPAVNVTSGPGPLAFEWKNLAWASQRVNGTIYSYDPVSGIETIYAAPAPTTGSQLWTRFFSVDDRLFVVYEKASRDFASTVYEFSLGSFISTGVTIRYDRGLPSGGTQPGRGVASSTAFKHGDSAYVVAKGSDPAASSAADEGLGFYRFFVNTPGGALQVQELTAQIPVAIRRAGPSTLPDQQRYMVWSFVDDQTDPANPQPYVIFCPESDAETGATLFRLVMDGVTEWVNEVSLPTTSYFGYPDAFWGAGHFLNGKETTGSKLVTGEVWTTTKGSAGVQLNYKAYGDQLVVPHGAVTAGPFETNETITSSSGGSATIGETLPVTGEVRLFSVTGTFLNGDTITQTTGTNAGANAVQSAPSSGGQADKTVRFRYYLDGQRTLGVPSTGICSLVAGSNSRGVIVGGNEIQNEIAEFGDNNLVFGPVPGIVEWDFLSDGIPEASVSAIKIEVERP
jgi:hypothetical protein